MGGGRLVAVGLCAVVIWPGVVEQSDLDARWINALAASGVALTTVLAVVAWRRYGGSFAPRRFLDPARVVIAVVLLLLAVPWLAAMVGISFAGVPVLGSVWQTDELRLQPGHEVPSAAVHAGHHHGLDGVLLALSALALSRMQVTRLRAVVGAYLALMLAYGLANAVQDAWLEQVVKRGWTSREIPSLIIPRRPSAGRPSGWPPSPSSPSVLRSGLGLRADGCAGRLAAPLATAGAATGLLLLGRAAFRRGSVAVRSVDAGLGAQVGGRQMDLRRDGLRLLRTRLCPPSPRP